MHKAAVMDYTGSSLIIDSDKHTLEGTSQEVGVGTEGCT